MLYRSVDYKEQFRRCQMVKESIDNRLPSEKDNPVTRINVDILS